MSEPIKKDVLVGIRCSVYGNTPFERCLACSRCYPRSVLKAIFSALAPKKKRIKEIHVTDITRCLRKSFFSKLLPAYITLDQAFRQARGVLLHKALLSAFPVSEIYISANFGGIEVHAHIDGMENGTIIELKTISRLPPVPLRHHVKQLWCYYTMAEMNGLSVRYGKLLYFSMQGFRVFDIPLLYVANWIGMRASVLLRSLREGSPPLSGERDEWECYLCPYRRECRITRVSRVA